MTREWDASTARSETDEFGQSLYQPGDRDIVEAVARVAVDRGLPRAQVALAWMLSKPVITAPIVGATKAEHLADAISAAEVTLTADEIALLEEHYTPRPFAGHT